MIKGADISTCGHYRYALYRGWDPGRGFAMFIGLNPSTADAVFDDPTIRRCIAFAEFWGYGALCMTNLFAWRATDPKDMMSQVDPVGPDNDHWLLTMAKKADVVVAAWGAAGGHLGRDEKVRKLLKKHDLHYLRLTKDGHPNHPLYLPKTLEPIRYPFPRQNSFKYLFTTI